MNASLPYQSFLGIACALASSLVIAGTYPGISQPSNPQSNDECQAMSDAWSARIDGMTAERTTCERADANRPNGPSISSKGVFLPNCGYTHQAYMPCAAISDQVCLASKQRSEAQLSCYSAVSANRARRAEQETAAAKVQQRVDELKAAQKAYSEIGEKGIVGYGVDRYTQTPSGAAARFQGAVREAARTTGSPGADSQPGLNRVGEVSDGVYRLVPGNAAATEIGSQSAAAARARMADALNQLDGALLRESSKGGVGGTAAVQPTTAVRPLPAPRINPNVSEDRDEADERAARERRDGQARLEMMRQLNESAQRILQNARSQSQAGRGAPSSGSQSSQGSTTGSSSSGSYDPRCQYPDGRARPISREGNTASWCTVK